MKKIILVGIKIGGKKSLNKALLLLFNLELISQCCINNLEVNGDLKIRDCFKLNMVYSE